MNKKQILSAVVLGILVYFFIPYTQVQVYAKQHTTVYNDSTVDYKTEPKAAVSNVNNIYTIYLGMPENDFKANWANVKGWTKLKMKTRDTYVYRKGNPKKDEVVEYIRTTFVDNKLVSFEVSFFTSSDEIKDSIMNDMCQTVKSQLGQPDETYQSGAMQWFSDNHTRDISVSCSSTAHVHDFIKQNFAEDTRYCYAIRISLQHQLVWIDAGGGC